MEELSLKSMGNISPHGRPTVSCGSDHPGRESQLKIIFLSRISKKINKNKSILFFSQCHPVSSVCQQCRESFFKKLHFCADSGPAAFDRFVFIFILFYFSLGCEGGKCFDMVFHLGHQGRSDRIIVITLARFCTV